MRKREYQSFTLKLSDLKEYEIAQKERAERKLAESAAKVADAPSTKYGPKTANEIRETIGAKIKARHGL